MFEQQIRGQGLTMSTADTPLTAITSATKEEFVLQWKKLECPFRAA
jgi:hypothetical protein